MPGTSSQRIFLCYRRDDTGPYALLLRGKLGERFGHSQIFRDLDSIELGLDYVKVAREAIGAATVVLALIGPKWATITDAKGRWRLGQPDDDVRFELRTALGSTARVIPVLLDGAELPPTELLPAELHVLRRLNYVELSYVRWNDEEGKLFRAIEKVFAEQAGDRIRPDPSRAARLIADAERIARTMTDKSARASALYHVGSAVLPGNPERGRALLAEAELLARSVDSGSGQVKALLDIASGMLTTAPDKVNAVLTQVRRLLPGMGDKDARGFAEYKMMLLLTLHDVDEAERVAKTFKDRWDRGRYLAKVAARVAATDLDRGQRIAKSLTEPHHRMTAQLEIARAVAKRDPSLAERLAHLLPAGEWRSAALHAVAVAAAEADPDRAERIANTILAFRWRASAFSGIAEKLAARDRDRARRLLAEADRLTGSISDTEERDFALALVAQGMAVIDPRRAERLARSVSDPEERDEALGEVAEAIGAADPEFAESVARSIKDSEERNDALAAVAEAIGAAYPDHAERVILSLADPVSKAVLLADLARILNGDF